jgi:hypothetical protein
VLDSVGRVLVRGPARLANVPAIAVALFAFAFGTYAFTATPGLGAYEPETAAVTEGFVRTGEFRVLDDTPMGKGQGVTGDDGQMVGRVGLPQPLLESPFYLAGWAMDGIASGNDDYRYRKWTVLFYNPFVLALVAPLIFLIMMRIHGSTAWSIAVAVMFVVASLAWPYAKLGLDATATLGMAIALFGFVAIRDTNRLWPWLTAGFGAGLAVAAKQYELPALVAMALLAWPALRAADAGWRVRRVAALITPFAAWMAGMAWYNWSRVGSPLKTGNAEYETTLAAPFNVVGFIVSPGKGLLWYSPLVIIGLLGLVALIRADRRLGLAIGLSFALGVVFVALTPNWTDETWGPRYLLPVAWLMLLPIPWWATTRGRRRVLGAVAVVAVAVQLVAILVPYGQIVPSTEALTGYPLFQQRGPGEEADVPFGRDSVRWIPQLSPLLIQGALVVSRVGQAVGTGPITLRYEPYEGAPHKLVLSREFAAKVGFSRPDFWWIQRGAGMRAALAALAALAAIGSAALLASTAAWHLRREGLQRRPDPIAA